MLSSRLSTRTTFLPIALAQANIRTVEQSAYVRRLLLAAAEPGQSPAKLGQLRQQVTSTGKASDDDIASARQHINRQIADPLDFDDDIALARLDDKIEALQEERGRYRDYPHQAADRRQGE